MSNLIVTFCRALGSPPVIVGRNCRSEAIAIGSSATLGDMVCDAGSNHEENVADLYAEADCWVDIATAPIAEIPGTDPWITSFFMATGERTQRTIAKGDRVSVIAG